MNHIHIFTDGSVNTQSKTGYGAYLAIADLVGPIETLKDAVKVKRFEQTSSTKLELQTLLWALNETYETINLTDAGDMPLVIYTDSQNIMSLPERRTRLEHNHFFSSKNRPLNNYELYQAFYRLHARLNCRFVKVAGHSASHQKDEIDKLFSLVDRASRRALRENC